MNSRIQIQSQQELTVNHQCEHVLLDGKEQIGLVIAVEKYFYLILTAKAWFSEILLGTEFDALRVMAGSPYEEYEELLKQLHGVFAGKPL